MLTDTLPRQDYVLGLSSHGFHRMAYVDWAGPGRRAPLAICAHGLTRTGRDFDALAEVLAGRWRVLCPDVVGRGRSDWLPAAESYGYPQYMADMTALIARSGAEAVDWIGTSMGGLIGLMLAAQPRTPIRRLVLNDVGPLVPKSALERIGTYVGANPAFASVDEAIAHLRKVHAPFGDLSEAQWRHLTEHALRRDEDGVYRLAYDPKIGVPFQDPERLEDVDLWALWDRIRCPVLVLRGRDSDLLLAETAQEMTRRGPKTKLVEFDSVGHAPVLMDSAQIRPVVDWLAAT